MKDKFKKIEKSVFVAMLSEDKGENFDIYLVNNSGKNYDSARLLFESTSSYDGDFLALGKADKSFADFLAGSTIKIDHMHYGSLDFLTWYHVDLLRNNAVVEKLVFSIKGPSDSNGVEAQIPILNKVGRAIKMEKRDDETIENEIKETDMGERYFKHDNE